MAVPLTPARLKHVETNRVDAQAEIKTWREAVELCNAFLQSDQRQTLPPGTIALDDDGMRFIHAGGLIPIRVECTTFGDLLVACHMAAQERSWGFIVGETRPGADRLTDNSFFRRSDGKMLGNVPVACTILHELTHTYLHCGIDDPWNAFRYYAEACLLFRYRTHSMERLPYRTSAEFYRFVGELQKAHPEWFDSAPRSGSNNVADARHQ